MPEECRPGSSWPNAFESSGTPRGSWRSWLRPRGVLRQWQEDVFERLLGDAQLADIDPIGDEKPVDRCRLRGVDRQDEGAAIDPDLLRFENGLEQAASTVQRRGPDEKRDPAAAGAQLIHGSLGDELAFRDHAHAVAGQLHLVEEGAGEGDG